MPSEIKTIYLWRGDGVKIIWMNPEACNNSSYDSSAQTLYESLFPDEGLPRGWKQ